MKKIIALLLISAVFLFGCVSQGSQPVTDAQPAPVSDSPQVNAPANNPVNEEDQETSPAPQDDAVATDSESQTPVEDEPMMSLQEFNLTARQWEFQPSTIMVRRGSPVKLHIASVDTTHGFSIVEFNVNSQLSPGQTTTVEFTPDRTGSFNFFCSVFCGSGHGGMRGTLVVTD